MLGHRLFSAGIIISVMVTLVWLDFQLGEMSSVGRYGLLLAGLAIIVSALASGELIHMWNANGRRLNGRLAMLAAMSMTAVASAPVVWRDYPVDCAIGKFGWSIAGFVIALVIVFAYEMFQFKGSADENTPDGATLEPPGSVSIRLGHYAFCFGYLLMLVGFLASHRMVNQSNAVGMFSIILLIATVKMSDSWAYFVGKSFGKHKLAPVLSPKKTWEGAFGAFLGAWFAGAIMFWVIGPYVFGFTGDSSLNKPLMWIAVYGFLVTLAGMMGDLAESLIKRDANCKDSSRWLPGLGGVLDVMDSLVFATPVSYFLWVV